MKTACANPCECSKFLERGARNSRNPGPYSAHAAIEIVLGEAGVLHRTDMLSACASLVVTPDAS
jgi:hypothetical protein